MRKARSKEGSQQAVVDPNMPNVNRAELPDRPQGKDALERDNRFNITQKQVEDALIQARGDILVAAKRLRLTVRELDNILRAIPGIGAFLGAIEEIKADNPEYAKLSSEWFERQASRAMSLYRLTALEELFNLASMDISNNAAMMNVKREAAVNLLGRESVGGQVFGELSEFFKSLNEEYHAKKPGVHRVRALLIEAQSGEAALVALPQNQSQREAVLVLPSAADRNP